MSTYFFSCYVLAAGGAGERVLVSARCFSSTSRLHAPIFYSLVCCCSFPPFFFIIILAGLVSFLLLLRCFLKLVLDPFLVSAAELLLLLPYHSVMLIYIILVRAGAATAATAPRRCFSRRHLGPLLLFAVAGRTKYNQTLLVGL